MKKNEQGFCDYCYSWGVIAIAERNMCTTCKEIEDGQRQRAVRIKRPSVESMRPLSERDAR